MSSIQYQNNYPTNAAVKIADLEVTTDPPTPTPSPGAWRRGRGRGRGRGRVGGERIDDLIRHVIICRSVVKNDANLKSNDIWAVVNCV